MQNVQRVDDLPPEVLASLHIAGLTSQHLEQHLALIRALLSHDERVPQPPTIVDPCAPSFLLDSVESQLVVEKYVLLGAASLCDASRCQLYSLPDTGDGSGALVAVRRLPYRSKEHRRELVSRVALLERAAPHRSLLTPVSIRMLCVCSVNDSILSIFLLF